MTTAYNKFFINGEWVEADRATLDVINPATEEAFAGSRLKAWRKNCESEAL